MVGILNETAVRSYKEFNMRTSVRLTKKNGKATWYRKVSSRRFKRFCSLVSFAKIYVRVEYGKYENVRGKKEIFYNDGTYDSKEAIKAFQAFLET